MKKQSLLLTLGLLLLVTIQAQLKLDSKLPLDEKVKIGKKNEIKDIYQISCFTNFNLKELQDKFKELGFKEIE